MGGGEGDEGEALDHGREGGEVGQGGKIDDVGSISNGEKNRVD